MGDCGNQALTNGSNGFGNHMNGFGGFNLFGMSGVLGIGLLILLGYLLYRLLHDSQIEKMQGKEGQRNKSADLNSNEEAAEILLKEFMKGNI